MHDSVSIGVEYRECMLRMKESVPKCDEDAWREDASVDTESVHEIAIEVESELLAVLRQRAQGSMQQRMPSLRRPRRQTPSSLLRPCRPEQRGCQALE